MARAACTLALLASIASLATAPAASAAPAVKLTASLAPERLGASTTIVIGFRIATPPGQAPVPPTQMQLLLPAGIQAGATDELGLRTCLPSRLERTSSCPGNSLIGHGGATVAVAFGSQLVFEHVRLQLYSGPFVDERQIVLVHAHGEHPALASLVLPGVILSSPEAGGELLQTSLPPIPFLPEAPDVALVRFHTTLGPLGIIYSERVNGRLIRFHPRGLALPRTCPRHGFTFRLRLRFQNAAQASAAATVPCP